MVQGLLSYTYDLYRASSHCAHGGLSGLLGVGIVPGNDTDIWLGASLSHLFPFSQLDLTLAEKKKMLAMRRLCHNIYLLKGSCPQWASTSAVGLRCWFTVYGQPLLY